MAHREQDVTRRDHRIPTRPSPGAPPPPRPFTPPPPPHYEKQKPKPKKQKTKEQLKKSQIKTAVVLVFFLVLLIIIAYLSTVLVTNEATGEMEKNSDKFPYEFKIHNVMSQDIPTRIEVKASKPVEFYVLSGEKYNDSLKINEIRSLALNRNSQETTDFVFEDYLSPGDYVIISYKSDNENDISIDYKFHRFFLMPFLWLISLIFAIPIILCVVWIVLLQSRKASALSEGYQDIDYDRGHGHYPPSYEHYDSADVHRHQKYHDEHNSHYHDEPTPSRYPHEDYSRPRPGPRAPPPPPQTHDEYYERPQYQPVRQRPHEPPSTQRMEYQKDKYESTTTTVPCKCGEIIVITDLTRPLRIKCPRCGRRGILEGKEASPEEEIFY